MAGPSLYAPILPGPESERPKPAPAAASSGSFANQAGRFVRGTALGTVRAGTEAVKSVGSALNTGVVQPAKAVAGAAGSAVSGFTRGLMGQTDPMSGVIGGVRTTAPSFAGTTGSVATTAPTPAKPSFGNVVGGVLPPIVRPGGNYAAGTGAFGEPVFNNESLAKLEAAGGSPRFSVVGGGVEAARLAGARAGGADPALAAQIAAGGAPQAQFTRSYGAAPTGANTTPFGVMATAQQPADVAAQKATLQAIDDQIFRLRGTAVKRSDKQMLSDLIATRAGIVGNDADRAAAAQLQTQQLGAQAQEGAADRAQRGQLAEMDAANAFAIENIRGAADAAQFSRPQYQTDAAGNLFAISGSQAQKVEGFQGAPKEDPLARAALAAYSREAASIQSGLGSAEEKQAALDALRARPEYAPAFGGRGQQQGAFSAPAGPQPGTVQDGFRFKGGNPSDPNAWEKV